MFDIDYIKTQYCKYKCNAKTTEVEVVVDGSTFCDTCQEHIEDQWDDKIILEDEACKLCQINNFIRELEDFKMLKSQEEI